MNYTRAADKWSDKADHEINRVIRGQNAEVANPRPERIPRGQSLALLQIIFVCQDATLRLAARPRGIHDASGVFTSARDEVGISLATKFFPAISTTELRAGRRFSYQHNSQLVILEFATLCNCTPQMVFNHQEVCL